MATKIRPETSKRNKYWIPKHRYYELKHHCLQYKSWLHDISEIEYGLKAATYSDLPRQNTPGDPTGNAAVRAERLRTLTEQIEQAARDTDPTIAIYILQAVTDGLSFTYLHERLGLPCSRDYYYERYRRFFWLLDRALNN